MKNDDIKCGAFAFIRKRPSFWEVHSKALIYTITENQKGQCTVACIDKALPEITTRFSNFRTAVSAIAAELACPQPAKINMELVTKNAAEMIGREFLASVTKKREVNNNSDDTPKTPVDAKNRTVVTSIKKGCAGFFNPNFHQGI